MAKSGSSLLSSLLKISFVFLTALVFLLALFFFIMLIVVRGKEVEVPNVTGRSFTEAVRVLNEHQLRTPRIEGFKFSDMPKDYVVEQRPSPGQKVKAGREIKVFLSKGAEAGIVPRVIGQTLTSAQSALQSLGLEVGFIVRVHSDDFPQEGIIIAHTPPANTYVQKGTKVNLLISLGPFSTQLTMPDIRGMRLQDADELLRSRGLRLGQVEQEPSPEVSIPNIILEQFPQPNERVKKGALVDVVVSPSRD